MFRGISSAVALAAILAAPLGRAAAEAPQQLRNKTIQLGWTSSVVEHDDTGRSKSVRLEASRLIYISSAGRLFERSSRSSGNRANQSENAPDATRTKGGEETALRFAGDKLVGNVAFAQGAVQLVATFDSSYSSCNLELVYGREGGGMKRVGVDGVLYTIDKVVPSAPTCSIKEGNVFAGQ